jgi:hypothetical protein
MQIPLIYWLPPTRLHGFTTQVTQNVKKLHDIYGLPNTVQRVRLMRLQCVGYVVWWGDIHTFGGGNLLESGHLQGKWIIRMGVAWTWLSIASNAKF